MPPSRAKANIMRELEVWELLAWGSRVVLTRCVGSLNREGEVMYQAEESAMPDTEHNQHHEH